MLAFLVVPELIYKLIQYWYNRIYLYLAINFIDACNEVNFEQFKKYLNACNQEKVTDKTDLNLEKYHCVICLSKEYTEKD